MSYVIKILTKEYIGNGFTIPSGALCFGTIIDIVNMKVDVTVDEHNKVLTHKDLIIDIFQARTVTKTNR